MKKLSIIAVLILSSSLTFAKMNFKAALMDVYPSINAQSRVNSCTTCHTISKWQRNPFGLDLQHYLRSNLGYDADTSVQYSKEFIMEGISAIKDIDSDGDGFTNSEEINAETLPGDKNDFPGSND